LAFEAPDSGYRVADAKGIVIDFLTPLVWAYMRQIPLHSNLFWDINNASKSVAKQQHPLTLCCHCH
jgi:hypothetical protein